MPFSEAYQQAYQNLPEQLEERYPNLSFDNHCYLRVALDHVMGDQWDTQIKRPAYQHLNTAQLKKVVAVLQNYLTDENLIHRHNQSSLAYRNARKKQQQQLKL